MNRENNTPGKVILVGAGPGDPGLLTLRGLRALESADAVLYDRLAGEAVLGMIPAGAELVDVGKNSGNHPVPQCEINAMLLEKAREGKTVVRLKGGDPYMFGRGAEELAGLAEAGVDFEVIPGVTSALAVPAYAGIPLTHRDYSSSVHIMTGHLKSGAAPGLDYESLVKLGGTLVFMMSTAALESICGGLLGAGMESDTPAAIIENGTGPRQRKLVATVSDIAKLARGQGFSPPSVVVVGGVCALSGELDRFSKTPLFGINALVTRPTPGCGALSETLRTLGCGVTEYPCIETIPLKVPDSLFKNTGQYGWIAFTSAVGVRLFFEGLFERGLDLRALAGVKLAAVGAATAGELKLHGAIADYMPREYSGEALALGLAERAAADERILLFRAAQGGGELPRILGERGFRVDDAKAYETVCANGRADEIRSRLEAGEFDFVTFTSASTVTGLMEPMPGFDASKIRGICIGEKTAARAAGYGIETHVSETADMDGMTKLIRTLTQKERENP